MKVVFLDRATLPTDIVLPKLTLEHEWFEYSQTQIDQVVERLQGARVAITNKVPLRRAELSRLPDLEMIAVAATGTDIIDLDYCRERQICVSNIRHYADRSVPEHVLALMINLRRNLSAYQQDVREGQWQHAGQFCFFNHRITDLAGSCLGIIGAGQLGQATGKLAKALGMEVLFAGRKPETDAATLGQVKPQTNSQADAEDASAASSGPPRTPFAEVLARSDIISLHCPLTPKTRDLIGLPELQQMKTSALLINTARGGIVNEADLVVALQQGLIAGAGFDVLSQEPPPQDHPLLALSQHRNFILTPHVAWGSRNALERLVQQLIDNINGFLAGEPRNQV